jgi:GAF domain-containing protein
MVKDEKVVGVLIVGRTCVKPFTEKQIELVTDFAAQAAIALQITRREREYREVQNELAHANRLATIWGSSQPRLPINSNSPWPQQ